MMLDKQKTLPLIFGILALICLQDIIAFTPPPGTTVISCGEYDFISPGGSTKVISPNFPSNYPNNIHCGWLVLCSPAGNKLVVNVHEFNVVGTKECLNDSLTIRNGRKANSSILAHLCGTSVRKVYVTSAHEIRMSFKSDSADTAKGFNITVSCVIDASTPTTQTPPTTSSNQLKPGLTVVTCGEFDFIDPGGNIDIYSANYPSNYNNNENCKWAVQCSGTGSTLRMTFKDSLIQQSPNCSKDHLIFRDGLRAKSPLMGYVCGNISAGKTFLTTQNTLRAEFNTDATINAKGWSAVIFCSENKTTTMAPVTVTGSSSSSSSSFTVISCGEWLAASPNEPQIIMSQNYPKDYPNNQHCTWLMECLTPNLPMVVTVISFNVTSSPKCQNDYLSIFNGSNSKSPLFVHLCGTNIRKVYVLQNEKIRFLFVSDKTATAPGFNISVKCVQHPATPTTQPPLPTSAGHNPPAAHVCGEFVSIKPGVPLTISSPNFPLNYPDNLRCKWIAKCNDTSGYLNMVFEQSAIQPSTACSNDHLYLLNGQSATSTRLANLCGNITANQAYKTTGNTLRIEFNTDSTIVDKGWRASISCNVNITTTTLTTPATTINITTTTLTTPATTTVPSGFVSYVSCGEWLGGSAGVPMLFNSQNFPKDYPNNQHCMWVVECLTPNLPMTLKFTSFNVAASPSCTKDYVAIFNGKNIKSPVVARLCGTGTSVRKVFVVPNQAVRVEFRSDNTITAPGFNVSAECVQPAATPTTKPAPATSPGQTTVPIQACGEYLYLNAGTPMTIKSPNYPGNYPNDLRCKWAISCNKTRGVMRIVFEESTIQQTTGCTRDQLVLLNGPQSTSPKLATLCGTIADDTTYIASNGTIRIEFNTDTSIVAKGFQAKVTCISTDWKAIKVCKGSSISPYLLYMILPAAYLSISSLNG